MNPRDEPEPDFEAVAPYDAIVRGVAALGSQLAGLELARETWRAIQEEKIRAWDEAQEDRRRVSQSPPPGSPSPPPGSPSETPLPRPPARRRAPGQGRQDSPGRRRQESPEDQERQQNNRRRQTQPERQTPQADERPVRRSPESPSAGNGDNGRAADGKDDDEGDSKPVFRAKVVRGQTVDSEMIYQPDPKIVALLASGKYVPMWHFIERNCKDAAMRQVLAGDSDLTLKVEGRSFNLSGDSVTKGALKDDQITYNDFHHAQPLLIAKMYETKQYDPDLIEGLVDMFHALDRHPIREKRISETWQYRGTRAQSGSTGTRK